MGAAMVLAVVVVLCSTMVLPGAFDKGALGILLASLPIVLYLQAIFAIHITLLAMVWVLLGGFVSFFQVWPFSLLGPLIGYGVVVALAPQLRRTVGWGYAGRFDANIGLRVVATVVVASAGLVVWTLVTKPDLAHHLALIPSVPLWTYPVIGVGFACLNAAMEEVVFRGVMMEALDSALGEGYGSVGVQAVAFAAFHYLAGFPNGMLGFAMAFVYGIMLGMLRRYARGLFAPWAAHVGADLTIFTILALILI
jgi:membrane protease YdiL (CAAX protease family)